MQAVGVAVDALEGGVLVEVARQRQLHDVAGAVRVGAELVERLVELALAGPRAVAAVMPTLAQSECLPRT